MRFSIRISYRYNFYSNGRLGRPLVLSDPSPPSYSGIYVFAEWSKVILVYFLYDYDDNK